MDGILKMQSEAISGVCGYTPSRKNNAFGCLTDV